MGSVSFEIIVLLLLTLLQGFFSGSEIALISLRKSKVREVEQRHPKAAVAIRALQADPEKFIATTQIGISVITVVASVFAGANLAEHIMPYFANSSIGWFAHYAAFLSSIVIVVIVSYVTLVIGELVPKSLALRYPQSFAVTAAYPIRWIAILSYPLIRLLTFTSNIFLRPFSDKASFVESRLSEEEIRNLIDEGQKAGAIDKHEHEILENVFDFSDTEVAKIMTPRHQITALDISHPVIESLAAVIDSDFSRIPFYRGNLDNIVGMLNIKDLLPHMGKDAGQIPLADLLTPAYFVPNTKKIADLLREFQKEKLHIALVTDEHGQIDGLVTMEDVLEEIVGEISDETDEVTEAIVPQGDGSHVVEGSVSIVDFNRFFDSQLPEDDQYTTISGFILDNLTRFPEHDDLIQYQGYGFRVVRENQPGH